MQEKERQKQKDRAENYETNLEKLKERNKNNHVHIDKVKEEIEEDRNTKKKTPLYKLNEQNDRIKKQEEREEYEAKLFEDKQKRKELYRSINHEEISNYKRKLEEDFLEKKQKLEEERKEKLSQIDEVNANLPKQSTEIAKKIIDEDNEKIKVVEHNKEKIIVKNIKIKTYAKAIKHMIPKISTVKHEELENLKKKFNNNIGTEMLKQKEIIEKVKKEVWFNPNRHHRVNKSILFKKHDPSKPHKFNLNNDDSIDLGRNKRKNSLPSLNHSLDDSIRSIDKKIRALNSPKKHIIPVKPKDYLREMSNKKEHDNTIKHYSEMNDNNEEEDPELLYEREAGKIL